MGGIVGGSGGGGKNPADKLMAPIKKLSSLMKALPNPLDLLSGMGEGAKGGRD